MRHLILEEPVSRAAIWSRRLAGFALPVTVIAVALLRFRSVEPTPGFAALSAGLLLALAAAGCALAAFARIWTEGRRGFGLALKGLLLSLLVLAYPGWFVAKAAILPALTDISTDIDDPPAFSRSRAALEARGGRVPPDVPVEERRKQRDAYPQIAPLFLDMPPDEAYELVRKAAVNRRWEVIESARPGGRIGLGRLEAVDRTFLLRIPDDVTVRIRPRADGARIDVRSASRLGRHDFGQNAARIRRFLDEVSNLAISSR
jgi:uncharacterized protein (DUF1499 family)